MQLTAVWSSDVQSSSKRFDEKRTKRPKRSEVKFTIAVKNIFQMIKQHENAEIIKNI